MSFPTPLCRDHRSDTIENRMQEQGAITGRWSSEAAPCGWCGRETHCIFDLAEPLKGVVLSRKA